MGELRSSEFFRSQFSSRYFWLSSVQPRCFGTLQIGRYQEVYVIYRALWVIWWLVVLSWDLLCNTIGLRWFAYLSNWSYTLLVLCCILQLTLSIYVYMRQKLDTRLTGKYCKGNDKCVLLNDSNSFSDSIDASNNVYKTLNDSNSLRDSINASNNTCKTLNDSNNRLNYESPQTELLYNENPTVKGSNDAMDNGSPRSGLLDRNYLKDSKDFDANINAHSVLDNNNEISDVNNDLNNLNDDLFKTKLLTSNKLPDDANVYTNCDTNSKSALDNSISEFHYVHKRSIDTADSFIDSKQERTEFRDVNKRSTDTADSFKDSKKGWTEFRDVNKRSTHTTDLFKDSKQEKTEFHDVNKRSTDKTDSFIYSRKGLNESELHANYAFEISNQSGLNNNNNSKDNSNSIAISKSKQDTVTVSIQSDDTSSSVQDTKDGTGYRELPLFYKFVWILYNISCNTAITITVVFWLQFMINVKSESQSSLFLSLSVHLVNTVYVIADLLISGIPIRILHFWYSFLLGTTYTLFSIIYATEGGDIVYRALDWSSRSVINVGFVICMCIICFLVQLAMFCLYWLKLVLSSHCQ